MSRISREQRMMVRAFGGLCITGSVVAVGWNPGAALGRSGVDSEVARGATVSGSTRSLGLAKPPGRPSLFPAQAAIWAEQRAPLSGPARVYGRTTCGCIVGAIPLPARGEGFVRRRPWRRTGFGHPDLVRFVERLGKASRRAGLGDLVIGDLSLPRGGAYLHGHASHQTGLDVDIAYRVFAYGTGEHFVATWKSSTVPSAMRPQHLGRIEALLRLAAADERVDRIFVGAGVKQLLCRTVVGDRGFLQVLRPWLGHEQHFHVRLKCPADSPDCRPNEPVATIPDGCEELSSWWKHADVATVFADWWASERVTYLRDLPEQCRALTGPAGNLAQLPTLLDIPRVLPPASDR